MTTTTTTNEEERGRTEEAVAIDEDSFASAPKVEVKTKEEVLKRIQELRAKMHNLKPTLNRQQRRAAEAQARRVKKKKIKARAAT